VRPLIGNRRTAIGGFDVFRSYCVEIDCFDDGVLTSSLEIGVSTALYWLSYCVTSIYRKLQVGCLFLNLPRSFLACTYTLPVSLALKLSAV